MDKTLKILAIITLGTGMVFLILNAFVSWGSTASLIPFGLLVIILAIMEFKNLIILKRQIDEDYPLFLAEQFRKGNVTREAVESQDPSFKKLHERAYRFEKFKIIGLGVVLICLAAGLFSAFIFLV